VHNELFVDNLNSQDILGLAVDWTIKEQQAFFALSRKLKLNPYRVTESKLVKQSVRVRGTRGTESELNVEEFTAWSIKVIRTLTVVVEAGGVWLD